MKDDDLYEIDVPTLMGHLADLNENQIIEILHELENLPMEDISEYLNIILEHLKNRSTNTPCIEEKIRKVKWYSSIESLISC